MHVVEFLVKFPAWLVRLVDARLLDLVYLFTASWYSALFPCYLLPITHYYQLHMKNPVSFKPALQNFLLALALQSPTQHPLYEHFPCFLIQLINNLLVVK